MSECRLCRAELQEGDELRCDDTKRCTKRVRANLRRSVGTMVTAKYVGGFDPAKAYREQMAIRRAL